jgi:hypothetical protein
VQWTSFFQWLGKINTVENWVGVLLVPVEQVVELMEVLPKNVPGVSAVEMVHIRKHGRCSLPMANNQRLRDVEVAVRLFTSWLHYFVFNATMTHTLNLVFVFVR